MAENSESLLRDLFKRFSSPANYGVMEDADIVSEETDYSCGDRLKMYFKLEEGKILDVKFTSEACLFCNASASLLADMVKGKTLEEALRLKDDDLLRLFKAGLKSPRYRCIVLPLKVLRKALQAQKTDSG
ncbi:MAG: iron-sulfur cluster assembly scaffold protein [Thermoproteota archaeon]